MNKSPKQHNPNAVHMQKHETPTTLAEFLLAPMIAMFIIDGMRPPIPHPLPIVPRYSAGNMPSTAVALPEINEYEIIFQVCLIQYYFLNFSYVVQICSHYLEILR